MYGFKFEDVKIDAREIEKSNKIILPGCAPSVCPGYLFQKGCWCCLRGENPCWDDLAICESKCPPINSNP